MSEMVILIAIIKYLEEADWIVLMTSEDKGKPNSSE